MSESDAGGDLVEQPRPEKSRCPQCREPPTDESVAEHRLSALGYHHDDQRLRCANGHEWWCGVPIGGPDGELGGDLWCDSCDDEWMFVHRVRVKREDARAFGTGEQNTLPITLDLKCPNGHEAETSADGCYYFDQTGRETDQKGIALVGYPPITGAVDGADAYGYTD